MSGRNSEQDSDAEADFKMFISHASNSQSRVENNGYENYFAVLALGGWHKGRYLM